MHGKSQVAKSVATEASHKSIDRLLEMIPTDPEFHVTATVDSIVGDHAYILIHHEQDQPKQLHLVKFGANWKVDLVATAKDQKIRMLEKMSKKKMNNNQHHPFY